MTKFVNIYLEVIKKKNRTLRDEILVTTISEKVIPEPLPKVILEEMELQKKHESTMQTLRHRDYQIAMARLDKIRQQISKSNKSSKVIEVIADVGKKKKDMNDG